MPHFNYTLSLFPCGIILTTLYKTDLTEVDINAGPGNLLSAIFFTCNVALEGYH